MQRQLIYYELVILPSQLFLDILTKAHVSISQYK